MTTSACNSEPQLPCRTTRPQDKMVDRRPVGLLVSWMVNRLAEPRNLFGQVVSRCRVLSDRLELHPHPASEGQALTSPVEGEESMVFSTLEGDRGRGNNYRFLALGPCLNARCIWRWSSRWAMASRLSYCFLPRPRPSSTFAIPFLRYSLRGTRV